MANALSSGVDLRRFVSNPVVMVAGVVLVGGVGFLIWRARSGGPPAKAAGAVVNPTSSVEPTSVAALQANLDAIRSEISTFSQQISSTPVVPGPVSPVGALPDPHGPVSIPPRGVRGAGGFGSQNLPGTVPLVGNVNWGGLHAV